MDLDDKFSIKTLLFNKARKNYVIPVPAEGHKIYPCIDCGDKFMFETSYNDHINRKSMQITYNCRYCNETKVFFNRCKLLRHIRSHTFKTFTINISDLNLEPLPLNFFKTASTQKQNSSTPVIEVTKKSTQKNICYECKLHILPVSGIAYKDRASHFMQYTDEVHSCPVCLFALPNLCGLRAHMRFHLNCAPFFCPECGVHLPTVNMQYPFNHDCEGFKMMRATTRLKCPVPDCHLIHPNDFKEHMTNNHLKKVYKCPLCAMACYIETIMNKHMRKHHVDTKASIFYQCDLCPGRPVVQNNINHHLRTHVEAPIFPCWTCGATFKEVRPLIDHHLHQHQTKSVVAIKSLLDPLRNENGNLKINAQRIYRVVKRCEQCQRNFTYKCNYNEISVLPSQCPFKCSKGEKLEAVTTVDAETHITCHLCKEKMIQNWEQIKKHYTANHKMHKCLDLKLKLPKINVSKYIKKKNRNVVPKKAPGKRQQNKKIKLNKEKSPKPVSTDVQVTGSTCSICEYVCESELQLKSHFLSHKDPYMAYQCMECGQSFVVKPSFSTHLMIVHDISNADEYINSNQCYNANALEKFQNSSIPHETLQENQCKICREQFQNSDDLTKHFRMHGMAFLMKNTSNKSNL